MKTIVVVSPTLDDYMQRVRLMAQKHIGDEDKWFTLSSKDIDDEEDRDEFSFIKMAVWNKLMEKEFFPPIIPIRPCVDREGGTSEPGIFPGSTFWDGVRWMLTITQNSLIAF